MKTFLVPTDGSPAARQAVQYVASLLRDATAPHRLLLLHTYLPPTASTQQVIAVHDRARQDARARLNAEIAWAATQLVNPQVTISGALHMGSLDNVVAHLIPTESVDCVVLGRAVLGTGKAASAVEQRLLAQLRCPLVIVPDASDAVRHPPQ